MFAFAPKPKEPEAQTKSKAPKQARWRVAPRLNSHSVGPAMSPDARAAAMRQSALQRKATVSEPGDTYEREADEVADQVMRMAEPAPLRLSPMTIQRKCAACEEEEEDRTTIQRESAPAANDTTALDVRAARSAVERGGEPLPKATRDFFEARFGQDFGRVRVQIDDAAARAVQARAYTVGQNIVFARGQYAPGTAEGKRLLAHELTHVVQQSGSTRSKALVDTPSAPAERAASLGAKAGGKVSTISRVPLGLYRKATSTYKTGDLVRAKGKLFWLSDLSGEPGAVPLPPVPDNTLLKLGAAHPKGLGKAFFANVMKSPSEADENVRPGIVHVSFLKPANVAVPAANAPTQEPPAPAQQQAAPAQPRNEVVWIDSGAPKAPAPPNAKVWKDPRYIDNKATALGWSVQQGGYYLVLFGDSEMPFALDSAMLKPGLVGPLDVVDTVYPTLNEANKNLGTAAYTYALTLGGNTIIPTAFSPSSTPRIMAMLEDLRKQIAIYAQQMMDLFTVRAVAIGGAVVMQVVVPPLVNAGIRRLEQKFHAAPVRQVQLPAAEEAPAKSQARAQEEEAPATPKSPKRDEKSAMAGKRPAGTTAEEEPAIKNTRPKEELVEAVLWKGRTRDGHELYVTRDLRIFRCTTCEEVEQTFAEFLHLLDPESRTSYRDTLESIRGDFRKAKTLGESTEPSAAVEAKSVREAADKRLTQLAEKLGKLKAENAAKAPADPAKAAPTKSSKASAGKQAIEIPQLTPPADPDAEAGRPMNAEAVGHLVKAKAGGAKLEELADFYSALLKQIMAEARRRNQEWRAAQIRCEGGFAFIGPAGPALVIIAGPDGKVIIAYGSHTPGPGALVNTNFIPLSEGGIGYAAPDLKAAMKIY